MKFINLPLVILLKICSTTEEHVFFRTCYTNICHDVNVRAYYICNATFRGRNKFAREYNP